MKIVFISDIHEDYESLVALFKKLERMQYEEIICLGDISGYSQSFYNYADTRSASKCLNLLRDNCSKIILGNHDYNSIKSIPIFSSSFIFPKKWYDLSLSEKKILSKGGVWLYDDGELDSDFTHDDIEFLKSCKEYDIIERDGLRILLSHYVFPNFSGSFKHFYSRFEEFLPHFQFMNSNNCTISVFGHLHNSTIFAVNQSKIIKNFFKRRIKFSDQLAISAPPISTSRSHKKCLILDTDKKQFKYL